jgi:hypothetical protein
LASQSPNFMRVYMGRGLLLGRVGLFAEYPLPVAGPCLLAYRLPAGLVPLAVL